MCAGAPYLESGVLDEPTSTKEQAMIYHPDLIHQLVTYHQQQALADAEHYRRVRECRAASKPTIASPRRRLSLRLPRLLSAHPRTT